MKVQYSVASQHNTVTNNNDEIIISFQSTDVSMSLDTIALMRGLGALFVSFQQTAKAVELLTTAEQQQ